MKISIITPTYNSEKTIRDTLESIRCQSFKNIELIVVDGVSSDKTLSIISEYENDFLIKIISEKDNGLYDAMNKGVKRVTGDIVHILNSDDFYANENVLKNIAKVFNDNPDIDAVYGDLQYIDKENVNKVTRVWKTGEYYEQNLNSGWIIPHPAFFVRNAVYKKLNKIFDTKLTISADYELILRLLKKEKIKIKYFPETLVKMRDGGKSNWRNIFKVVVGNYQSCKAWKLNNLKPPLFLVLKKPFKKIFQLFRSPN
jgi:glycosyltransferase involved in cell wall biosynthesis